MNGRGKIEPSRDDQRLSSFKISHIYVFLNKVLEVVRGTELTAKFG